MCVYLCACVCACMCTCMFECRPCVGECSQRPEEDVRISEPGVTGGCEQGMSPLEGQQALLTAEPLLQPTGFLFCFEGD